VKFAWLGLAAFAGCVDIPIAAESAGSSETSGTGSSGGEAPTTGEETAEPPDCMHGEQRDCFTGPPGSEPVAPCAPGSQTCRANRTWGSCHGSVLPTRQDCATPEDETCSGAGPVCAGAPAWLRAFTLTEASQFGEAIAASALAIAPDGDIVATGTYQGSITIAGDTHTASSDADIWVARFTAVGNPRWFRSFAGTGDPGFSAWGAPWSAGNIVFSTGSDIILTSKCLVDFDFGTGPLVGDVLDPVVIRMTATGEVKWARRFVGVTNGESGRYSLYVAARSDGALWLATTLAEPDADLGGGPLSTAGWGDLLLAQFGPDGAHRWSRRHGDPGHQEVQSIALTPDDGLVLTGTLEGALDLGLGSMLSAGTQDAWVARLDADGAPVWQHRYGDPYAQRGVGVQVDADGGVVLAGDFEGTIDLGGGPLSGATGTSEWEPGPVLLTAPFVAQLDRNGVHVWSRALGGADGSSSARSFARGSDGTLVLTGSGPIDASFTGDVWPGDAEDGGWIATLAADGSARWLQRGVGDSRATISVMGSVIATWDITTAVEFATVPLGAPDLGSFVLGSFGP